MATNPEIEAAAMAIYNCGPHHKTWAECTLAEQAQALTKAKAALDAAEQARANDGVAANPPPGIVLLAANDHLREHYGIAPLIIDVARVMERVRAMMERV